MPGLSTDLPRDGIAQQSEIWSMGIAPHRFEREQARPPGIRHPGLGPDPDAPLPVQSNACSKREVELPIFMAERHEQIDAEHDDFAIFHGVDDRQTIRMPALPLVDRQRAGERRGDRRSALQQHRSQCRIGSVQELRVDRLHLILNFHLHFPFCGKCRISESKIGNWALTRTAIAHAISRVFVATSQWSSLMGDYGFLRHVWR